MEKHSSKSPEANFSELLLRSANAGVELKFLDLILLSGGRPQFWLFTDTQGVLRAKPLDSIDAEELIRAVICNVEAQSIEIGHEDMWGMLEKYGEEAICFGLAKRGRIPLSVGQLVNIRNGLLESLEGLQLFRYRFL
eukprot:TRINITY_DN14889_c0_g1_i1.p1 TRINITY_DN14889_c0_g1~~TRINITY_DN14889_c0_g1_i1.p1  ORF type:complete len:137 (-),score=25.27 TRINITY_DN14889_c0_g1_i1:113-523(-)